MSAGAGCAGGCPCDGCAFAAHVSDRSEVRQLARGGVGGLLAAFVSGVGGLIFITVAARGFTKAEVGATFTLTSLFLIAVAFVTLGTDVGIVRFMAVKLAQRRDEQLSAVMAVTIVPVIVLSIGTAVGLWFTVPHFLPDHLTSMARLLAVFLPVAAVSNLTLAGTRGLGTVQPTVTIDGLLRQGLQPLLAVGAAWATSNSFWLLAAWVVPYSVSCVAGSAAYVRLCRVAGVAPMTTPWSASTRGVWARYGVSMPRAQSPRSPRSGCGAPIFRWSRRSQDRLPQPCTRLRRASSRLVSRRSGGPSRWSVRRSLG